MINFINILRTKLHYLDGFADAINHECLKRWVEHARQVVNSFEEDLATDRAQPNSELIDAASKALDYLDQIHDGAQDRHPAYMLANRLRNALSAGKGATS